MSWRGPSSQRMSYKVSILLLLSLLSLVKGMTNSSNYEWDESRVNTLGSGWDILVNEGKESIFVLKSIEHSDPSKQISTSKLPRGVAMKMYPRNIYHYYAEVIDQNKNIKDVRKISTNAGGKYLGIGGSFNVESQVVKQFISKQNHKVTRVSSHVILYSFDLETWELDIASGFYDRIMEILNALNKNTPVSKSYAIYLTDEILNIFGTHVVTHQKLGGILSKIDAVDISGYQNSVEQTLSASASASFMGYFKTGASIQTEHSDTETYKQSTTDTHVSTFGGAPWKSTDTQDTWAQSLEYKPATIGVELTYLPDLIRSQYFKTLKPEELMLVRYILESRINTYLGNNYYKGCADPKSSNYVQYSNVFDKNLCNYVKSFNFGGFYTNSNYPDFQIANVLTQRRSCPAGYQVKPFLHLSFQGVQHSYRVCHHHMFHKKCHNEYYYDQITTDTYICVSQENRTNGIYFGGVYTDTVTNDITQGTTCPEKYIPFPIYQNLNKITNTIYICLAPYDSGAIVSVPFGGLFSSQRPNYLSQDQPICPDGFERHPVGSNPIAEVTYCIGIGSLNQETKNIIPPGYGNSLTDLLDLYPIHNYENGSYVGISVKPSDSKPYYDQVSDLSLEVIPIETISKKKQEIKQKCYLEEWMQDQNIYQEALQLKYLEHKSLNVYLNTTNSSSSSSSELKTWMIILIVLIPILILILCVIIFIIVARYYKRYKYKNIQYEPI